MGFLLGVKSCHPIEFEPEKSETIEAWNRGLESDVPCSGNFSGSEVDFFH